MLCEQHGAVKRIGTARRILVSRDYDIDYDDDLHALLRGFPFIASMQPEHFFHPRDEVELIASGYDQEAMQLKAEWFRPTDPIRVDKRPGRNEPCSCGSGRKYKKCCVALAA